ncbi:MAG TPA: hypothetical protein VM818_07515 [Vicinamibacterales bacterium]|jgi:hypothetical protein|nr:hypothetical protein [Vicinamibacterales bacterium]
MSGSIYGRRYWLGAASIVVGLQVLNQVALFFEGYSLGWGRDAEYVLGLLSWPPLIIYHVVWTRRMRRKQSPADRY